jgi:hypothetical protein
MERERMARQRRSRHYLSLFQVLAFCLFAWWETRKSMLCRVHCGRTHNQIFFYENGLFMAAIGRRLDENVALSRVSLNQIVVARTGHFEYYK